MLSISLQDCSAALRPSRPSLPRYRFANLELPKGNDIDGASTLSVKADPQSEETDQSGHEANQRVYEAVHDLQYR